MAFPASLNSPFSEERVRAAKTAADYAYTSVDERRAALVMLVDRLDDEDAAVRMFAIVALEKLTGTRLGYVYYADPPDRVRAIASWQRYLDRQISQDWAADAGAALDAERTAAGVSASAPDCRGGGDTR